MKTTALLILSQLGITLLLSSVAAAEFDPRPASKKIDSFLNAHLKGKELAPNPTISDEQFLRRTYLAIIGRVPTIEEADQFLEATDPDKNSHLIEQLLANDAFSINKEDKKTRQRYGDDPFGQGCLLARRLIESNVRTVEVSLSGWDTHTNNFTSMPLLCQTMDQAMGALLEDLESSGKLDETVVVLTTEFGRTPIVNRNIGRDHYPQAFTSVLAGGGFKGGYVYGKTSEGAEEVVEKPITIPDFNATIAYALGIPTDLVLYSPSKRPFSVAHKGQPVLDLFA